ncbi:uncharacterized protein LOC124409585 [Diprion similis]|uniref:uncharacterized protein LOC124409585 n=1 Tax=Diprion similis TaxID=362088 RepID=UPI001EF86FA3|nr:uncharacterized protein LOC124409585 [Diprion similis]
MDPIKLRFYVEKYAKENRETKLVETFYATPKNRSITGKFYAKHEAITSMNAPQEYIDLIAKSVSYVPKDIYKYRPPAVNMDYGWFTEPLIPRSKDPRLYFPAKQCDFIKNELLIRHQNKGVPEEKFKGVPFKT